MPSVGDVDQGGERLAKISHLWAEARRVNPQFPLLARLPNLLLSAEERAGPLILAFTHRHQRQHLEFVPGSFVMAILSGHSTATEGLRRFLKPGIAQFHG